MSKIIAKLASKPYVANIDDERDLGNSIIVTLASGWFFTDEAGCGVRGFDTVAELRAGLTDKSVMRIDPEQTPIVAKLVAEADTYVSYYKSHGYARCPHCNIHLSNGISHHGDDVNGKPLRHKSGFVYECLGCGGGFGPRVPARRASVSTGKARPQMSASLKLDRRILCVDNNTIYANACQVWKAGLVSSSQGDRLSAVLYGSAKQGRRDEVVLVNGKTFRLAA